MASHTASMTNGTGVNVSPRTSHDIPHTISPGLWALAWKRLSPITSGWFRW